MPAAGVAKNLNLLVQILRRKNLTFTTLRQIIDRNL
jgi:hypothetical protein